MKISFRFLFTAGIGAAAMYYFDPDRGRQRRALLRERLEERRIDQARARHGIEGGTAPRRAAPGEGPADQPEPMH